jgi:BirA family biotin operon repressor/biotin-[acetyl-CoA-carboxylase] ligase
MHDVADPIAAVQPLKVAVVDGWRIHDYSRVDSTNLVAAKLAAWDAVRAVTQSAGRGRFLRRWVSDEGGLWLSAVVPVAPEPSSVRSLPLAVGWAVCKALREMGASGLRMRWPNDVLWRGRKLAGLLIDQFSPGLAVVGVGINVRNQPESGDPSLHNRTIRLVDLLPCVEMQPLTEMVLRHVRDAVNTMNADGFGALLSGVNGLWGEARRVELDLNGERRQGMFTGVDDEGRLLLADEAGGLTAFDASEVSHLTEL